MPAVALSLDLGADGGEGRRLELAVASHEGREHRRVAVRPHRRVVAVQPRQVAGPEHQDSDG